MRSCCPLHRNNSTQVPSSLYFIGYFSICCFVVFSCYVGASFRSLFTLLPLICVIEQLLNDAVSQSELLQESEFLLLLRRKMTFRKFNLCDFRCISFDNSDCPSQRWKYSSYLIFFSLLHQWSTVSSGIAYGKHVDWQLLYFQLFDLISSRRSI